MDGFWALTNDGRYQIDGTTPNMSCALHTVITAAAGYSLPIAASNTGTIYKISCAGCDFTFTASQPVVAIWTNGTIPVTMVSCVNQGGNVWKASFWAQNPTAFEIFVFDRTNFITSGSNYGLKVWDGSGNLIADATYPLMQPCGLINTQAGSFGDGWQGSGSWPRAFTNNYSQSGRNKVAVGAIETGQTVSGFGSSNSDGSNAHTYMSISGWATQAGGGVQMMWTDNTYGSPGGSYPSSYVGYGSSLRIAGLLIDVSAVP
jgi:hypothetical protein